MMLPFRLSVVLFALLLVGFEEQQRPQPLTFAEAADDEDVVEPPNSGSGKGGGKSDDSDSSEGDAKENPKENPNKSSQGRPPTNRPQQNKPSTGTQKEAPFGLSKLSIPLFWNTNSSASVSDESLENEEFNALVSRIFDRRLALGPRIRGALEVINDALSEDMLAMDKKMSPTERQRVLYGLGGKGSYMEVPELLQELRQEADHPVEEKQRIRGVNALRRRGVLIDPEDLKMRPYVKREFNGPVTTTEIEENLTDAEMQRRQAAINGWLQKQQRQRQLHKNRLRNKTPPTVTEPINDDNYSVSDDLVRGLGFKAQLSSQEGEPLPSSEFDWEDDETGVGRRL